MKLRPALKKAKSILRKAGIDSYEVGSMSLHIGCTDYNPHPLIVDIKLSPVDDVAKFDVCWLSEEHSMYAAIRSQFHGVKFDYATC